VRTVLVTGATGAIGSEVARLLLHEADTRIRLLLRARSREHLDQRLLELFRYWQLDPRDPAIAGRVEAFAGDITGPRLGLDEQTSCRLSAQVTHVIHAAGNVKLNRPLDEARQSAVGAVRHVLEFVERCQSSGRFQKLDYVSTVGVGGRMPNVVPERPLDEPRTFRNSYEAAKAEAEDVLLGPMVSGVPVTIHRPSMVVGDSKTGKIIQFQVFYHLCEFLSGRRTLGIIPDTHGYQLDIIPVDYVARAIQISSVRDDARGRVFHLSTAEDAPTLDDLAERIRRRLAVAGRPVPRLRRIPLGVMKTLLPISAWCVGGAPRRALRTLPFFLAYLESPQTFANVQSRAFFGAAGVRLPAPETYLDPVLSYYLDRRAA
jgi:thioester reductase-like protein